MNISKIIKVSVLLLLLLNCARLIADEIRPAYLQLNQITDERFDVFFKIPAQAKNLRQNLRVVFNDQVTLLADPIGGYDGSVHKQFFSIATTQQLQGAKLSIEGLAKTNTEVLMQIAFLNGATLAHRFTPDNVHFTVAKTPEWHQVIKTYFIYGVEHIWFGIDHLLFVLVLLMLVPSARKLIGTITAFTIAHSITLILASLDVIRVPVPPVEACIALSIVFVATEIIRGQQGNLGLTARRPWLVAFIFGLLHGLGFAAALEHVGLPQNAVASALLVFNFGVEFGQLIFVFAVLLAWQRIKPLTQKLPTVFTRAPAYCIGGLASLWLFERVNSFW